MLVAYQFQIQRATAGPPLIGETEEKDAFRTDTTRPSSKSLSGNQARHLAFGSEANAVGDMSSSHHSALSTAWRPALVHDVSPTYERVWFPSFNYLRVFVVATRALGHARERTRLSYLSYTGILSLDNQVFSA